MTGSGVLWSRHSSQDARLGGKDARKASSILFPQYPLRDTAMAIPALLLRGQRTVAGVGGRQAVLQIPLRVGGTQVSLYCD